ncbi:MAG TPA: hypothetical protein VMU88_01650, partial [bacterium]|nr:hypothetical protein [bacterium]
RRLAPLTAFAVVTEPANPRAEKAVKVFEAWERAGVRAIAVGDWRRALWLAGQKTKGPLGLLITGSLYLLGDCRKELRGLRGLEKI